MKIRKYILGLICLALTLSLPGIASAGQESGFYLGGSAGRSSLEIAKQGVDFDDDDFGYKIFGGYNLGIIPLIDVGVEGSFVDLGKASSSQILDKDVSVTAWDLFAVGAVNLGPVGIFGKVGQAWWKSDSDVLQSILDKSGNDMAYGIGLRFQVWSLAVRAEYEYFDLDLADIGFASVGASWTF